MGVDDTIPRPSARHRRVVDKRLRAAPVPCASLLLCAGQHSETGRRPLRFGSDEGAMRCGPHRTGHRLGPVPSPRAGLPAFDCFVEPPETPDRKEANASLDDLAASDPANVLSADRPLPAGCFDQLRCPIPHGGGDETPFQGERQISYIASPEVKGKKPHSAKGCRQSCAAQWRRD